MTVRRPASSYIGISDGNEYANYPPDWKSFSFLAFLEQNAMVWKEWAK